MSGLWKSVRHPSLAVRLQFIVATSLLCLVLLGALAEYDRYDTMRDARVDKLRAVTDQAISIAGELERQVQAGSLSRDQALRQFRDIVRPIRFDGNSGYLFAYDMDGKTLVLGPTPKVEGTSRLEVADAHGVLFIRAMIDTARQGGGTVGYWYPKPGTTVALPKLAYVAPVVGWNLFVGTGLYIDDLRNAAIAGIVRFGALVGLLILVCAVVAWAVSQSITRPLRRLHGRMASLADGDLSTDVAGVDRHDEIGAMALAVQVFRNSGIEMVRLKSANARAEISAAEEKKRAMAELAHEFEASVGGIVQTVTSSAAEMERTASSMTSTAEETLRRTTAVASASEQASTNVQSVASAAEELSISVGEISRQVATSAAFAAKAVSEAERTDVLVNSLAGAARKIGAVSSMIGEIAGRTNLLALNATIEAARAGEAGKGFAVVAAEVKSLATQTARATGEISQQIVAIQGATSDTVAAIRSIGATIGQMNEIAATIAAAVEEQGAATREIARNVQQAAAGTAEVSGNIGGVAQTVGETGTAAGHMLGAAGELSAQSDALRGQVERFLGVVRAA
jgi:methyl-accepting chemotaxis protein